MERWAIIPGFEGRYEASTEGRIRQRIASPRRRSGFIVPQNNADHGYKRVGLYADGKFKCFLVHRLVAETFMPARAKGTEVNHINGDKADNRIENLEWITHTENMRHASRVLGRRFGKSRLTDEQVREIRASVGTCMEIASAYGVSAMTISRIRTRKSYKEVQ